MSFFWSILKAIVIGDALNIIGYRIRPYEVNPGETDAALAQCQELLATTLRQRSSLPRALSQCRRILRRISVNRLQAKPKVSIIGEFWAMTTEGDGNYQLQRFLESEGAEVDIQPVTAWLLYNLWTVRYDTKRRQRWSNQEARQSTTGVAYQTYRTLALMGLAERALRTLFWGVGQLLGLRRYHLADMDEIATISHQHYDNHLRGGEGHMEVGKLIQAVEKRKAHMVVSVKPFGCMPSSGVSDGVQSMITARYPEAVFCAIETTGDGAVNVQSRLKMDLFKAKQNAQREYDALLQDSGLTHARAAQRLAHSRRGQALYASRHHTAGTAANLLAEQMSSVS